MNIIYRDNDADVEAIMSMEIITPAALNGVHRHVAFQIVCRGWKKCDSAAKKMLLNHEHSHVRSAAIIENNEIGSDCGNLHCRTIKDEALVDAHKRLNQRLI